MKTFVVLVLMALSFAGGVYVGQSTSFDFKGTVDDVIASDEASDAPETDGEAVAVSEAEDVSDDTASEVATPPPAPASTDGDETVTQYRAWISEARAEHPYSESEEKMWAVMMCESGGQADIANSAGPYTGLFQYSTQTWNGDWNTYRDSGITNARAQIFATALAWSIGMQSHWGCYSRTQ